MTTLQASTVALPAGPPARSVTSLARADALRFARHPLFLSAVAIVVLADVIGIAKHQVVDVGVEGSVFPAFFIGVFGFVVAHRLSTALGRTGGLADTAPVGAQSRTAALCIACLVPMTFAIVAVMTWVIFGAVWPPTMPEGHVAWFGYESNLDVWGVLVGDVVLASLGGPLLGVAVARWAPFRGSAVLGMTLLVAAVMMSQAVPSPWYAVSPWTIFNDEHVVGGQYQSSWIPSAVAPAWWCGYAASLCAMAALAALLRADAHRRQLLLAGAIIATSAVAFLLLAVT